MPPYLHPPVTASVRFGVSAVMITVVRGCLSLLPVPDSCRVLRAGGRVTGARSARAAAPQAPLTWPSGSGSCRAPGQGGPGGAGSGSGVLACGLSVRGDQPWRPGRGQEQPALPRSAGRSCCPGDMMIDWVSPACGDAAAQSNQAVRLAGPAAADSGSAGAGRGGPHQVSAAAAGPAGPARSRAGRRGMGGLRRRRARRRRARPGCGTPGGGSCGLRTARRACRCTGP